MPVELAEGLAVTDGAARMYAKLPQEDRETIAEYVAMAPTPADRRRRARSMLEALKSMALQEAAARALQAD